MAATTDPTLVDSFYRQFWTPKLDIEKVEMERIVGTPMVGAVLPYSKGGKYGEGHVTMVTFIARACLTRLIAVYLH